MPANANRLMTVSADAAGLQRRPEAQYERKHHADDETAQHQLAGLQQRRYQHHHHRLGMRAGIAEIALQRC
jgi:hypothetical protein